MDGSAAPIDDAILEMIADRAQTHSLVEAVHTEHTGGVVSLVTIELDCDRYPDNILDARIEIQWHTNGDYNFHYIETHTADDIWQCRWDKHMNPHTTRTHFHPPPEASSADAIPDRPSDYHPTGIFTRTLANVRQRVDDLWGFEADS
jgi:hypothetical protein